MSEFMFPILSIDDLVSSLAMVMETDFKKPEPARWYKIYGLFFESLTDEKAEQGEEKARVLFPKYCKSENPELYEDASCILWFTLVLQQLFFECGISDFTFKDIREPKQKRCIIICSAVVNFMLFKANRVPIIESIFEKVDRSKIQYDKIEKTNSELNNRIGIEMAEHNERGNKIQQVQEELRSINDNMETIQDRTHNLLAKISEKQMRICEGKARRDEVKCQIMKVKQECAKLQQNIVHSPQKLKDNLSSMHEKVESLMVIKAEKLELVSTRRKRLDELKTRNGIVEQGISFMQAMVKDVENRKSIEEEIKGINESRQVTAQKTKAMTMEAELSTESTALIQDRIKRVQLQKRTRGADLDAYFNETALNKKESTVKAEALQAEKEKLKREKETWMENIESTKKKTFDKKNESTIYYKKILESLNQYHLSLNEKTG